MKELANFCRTVLPAVWGSLMLAACSSTPRETAHHSSDEETEVAILMQRGSADSLATASLLAHLISGAADGQSASPDPTALIERAVAQAPDRPELIWLQLRDCEQRRCAEESTIAGKLKAIDPDNGLAWLADTRAAQNRSDLKMTQAIERMAAGRHPQLYWNKLTVMMYDALTHGERSRPATAITQHPDDRLTHVVGILAAVNIPAFQTVTHACRLDHFDLQGRRAACETLMIGLETSDAVLTQNLSLSLQESWWPPGTPKYETLHQKLLQQRYLTVAAGRARGSHADADAQMRIDVMRHVQREDEVERAMLTAFHEPLDRPANWSPPGG
jgi:hypothetical protein